MNSRAAGLLPVTSRVAAALLGGYVFAWGFTSLVVAATIAGGGDYDEGVMLAYLLVFLVYVVALLWAFAAASVTRVWLILLGSGVVMTGIAWGLTQALGLQH